MKISILSVCLFLSITGAMAQNAGKISGTVLKNAKPADGATVSLLRAKDSATVKLSAANKEGLFIFENIRDGKYILSITAVGHQKAWSPLVEITSQAPSVQVPAISLSPVSKNLAEVTVTSKRPLIEQRIDRTIVNVEASITNIGTSALEVLEKAPGVTVDRDGNISLKGKEGVLIMVEIGRAQS